MHKYEHLSVINEEVTHVDDLTKEEIIEYYDQVINNITKLIDYLYSIADDPNTDYNDIDHMPHLCNTVRYCFPAMQSTQAKMLLPEPNEDWLPEFTESKYWLEDRDQCTAWWWLNGFNYKDHIIPVLEEKIAYLNTLKTTYDYLLH